MNFDCDESNVELVGSMRLMCVRSRCKNWGFDLALFVKSQQLLSRPQDRKLALRGAAFSAQ